MAIPLKRVGVDWLRLPTSYPATEWIVARHAGDKPCTQTAWQHSGNSLRINSFTRSRISSRIARIASSLGSGSAQSIVRRFGTNGQASPAPIVTRTEAVSAKDLGEELGFCRTQIDPDFSHDYHNFWMHLVGKLGSRRNGEAPVPVGVQVEESRRHLRTTRIVDTTFARQGVQP